MSDDLTTFAHDTMPFTAVLDMKVTEAGPEKVVASVGWKPEYCTGGGIIHGGFLMAVADSLGAMCAFQHLPEGAGTATIESKTNFLRGMTEGEATVTSTPIHVGRTTIVVQTDITRADGKLFTRTTQTQAVLRP
jgi:uncharacterized protein (TIGR00369 family)